MLLRARGDDVDGRAAGRGRDLVLVEEGQRVAVDFDLPLLFEPAARLDEEVVEELAAGAGGVDALKAAAAKAGLKAEDEEAFRLGRPLGTAGADPALDAAVFQLKTGEGTKAPVKVGDKWVVVAVKERRDSKAEEFDKQKAELTERALDERRGQLFDDFLVEARRRLDEKGQIEIYRDTLALIDQDEPAALPRRPPVNIVPPGTE